MAYSNSEQIFIDVLGRSPTEDQWKEIHALLGIAQNAGFLVDEPSNAAHVLMLSWAWAHSTSRADVLALMRGRLQGAAEDFSESVEKLRDSLQRDIDRLRADLRLIEEKITALNRPDSASVHYDVADSFKEALLKSIKWTWVAGAIGIGLFVSVFWTRMYIQDTRQIANLATVNAAQAQQLKDLQAQPTGAARRAEHGRP